MRIVQRFRSSSPLLTILIGSSVALAACAGTSSSSDDEGVVDRYAERGSITLGVSAEPPYSYLTPEGDLAGIEPELAREVFQNMGIKTVKGTKITFSAMIPSLQASRFDVLTGNMFMKQSRCKAVIFSEPTTAATYSFVSKSGRTDVPATMEELAATSLKLIVIRGTVQSAKAEELGISGNRLIQVDDAQSELEALEGGRGDVILDIAEALKAAIADDASKFTISETVPDMPVTGAGVAFRKEDAALRDAFNVEYKKFQDSGEFAKLSEKYGLDPAPVLSATEAELCKTPG